MVKFKQKNQIIKTTSKLTKFILSIYCPAVTALVTHAQMGIGTTTPNSTLDVRDRFHITDRLQQIQRLASDNLSSCLQAITAAGLRYPQQQAAQGVIML